MNVFEGKGRLDSMSQQLGFDIPVADVPLPSKGKLYPTEHPLYGAESAEIRAMTAREEDILTSKALMKNGTVIQKLVESCLINKSVKVDSLLAGDRDALLIAIRVLGYGEDYHVKVTCPSCDQGFDTKFNLNSLAIKPLGAEPDSPGTNLFSYQLPLSKLKVKFKLFTGEDEKDMQVGIDRKRKMGSQVDSNVTTRLIYAIQSIDGETDKGKIATIATHLRAGDSRALRAYMDKIEPGVDMRQEITCKLCGEASEVDVPLGASFFWPDFPV